MWDTATGHAVKVIRISTKHGLEGAVLKVAVTPDGNTIAAGGIFGKVKFGSDLNVGDILLINGKTGKIEKVLKGHGDLVQTLSFSLNGRKLLSGADNLRLWDVPTGSAIRSFKGHESDIRKLGLSPDGKRAFSITRNGIFRLWNVHTGELINTVGEKGKKVLSADFTTNAKSIITLNSKSAYLWRSLGGTYEKKIVDFNYKPWRINTISANDFVVSGNYITRVYSISDGVLKNDLSYIPNSEDIADIIRSTRKNVRVLNSISRNGALASVIGRNGQIILYDLKKGDEIRRFKSSGNTILDVSFSKDGKSITYGTTSNRHRLRKIRGTKIATLEPSYSSLTDKSHPQYEFVLRNQKGEVDLALGEKFEKLSKEDRAQRFIRARQKIDNIHFKRISLNKLQIFNKDKPLSVITPSGVESAMRAIFTCATLLSKNTIATGDDTGTISFFDTRTGKRFLKILRAIHQTL